MQDISFFCDEHESSGDEDERDVEEKDWNYSHTALIKQANATSNRLVNVRQSSNTSLLPENFTKSSKENTLHERPDNQSDQNSNIKRHQTLWSGAKGFRHCFEIGQFHILRR